MAKGRFRAKPQNKYQPKNLRAKNERADDQIAPEAAAHSTDALQRWALATANIAQSECRANEAKMMDRIQSRYTNADIRSGSFQSSFNDSDQEMADQPTNSKQKRPISPDKSLQLSALHTDDSEAGLRQTKRHKANSPSRTHLKPLATLRDETGADMDEDAKYLQSSEWSYPSEDEVKVTRTRTYIEID